MEPEQRQIIAAFDFDGTLTRCDSLVPFLAFHFGLMKTVGGLICELPALLGFLLSWKTRQETKERILTRFFEGMSVDTLRQMGREFAEKGIHKILKADSLQRLEWHQNQGHRCILISASIDIYLAPWAASAGFQDILTSRLAFDRLGLATGRLAGLNCWGAEKNRRLLELLGEREGFILYAYGDSAGDRDLLALADHPVKVGFRQRFQTLL